MTFKHMKFEDSPTMRALEKVAKEKGLVKPESLEKKAAVTKKADYTPTPNLMENIFKLCAGLRDSGLKKEADEIEMNYLNLKRAQTLYETSKETGDDLVQSAHPKGSHKLEGVEGNEAVVEDILDQHLKMLEKVNKKPTGKLSESNSKDIIKSVKMALGQAPPPPPPPPPPPETTEATPEYVSKIPPDVIDKWVKKQLIEEAWKVYGSASGAMSPLVTKLRNKEIEEYITTGIGERLQKANNAQAEMRNSKTPSVEGFQAMLAAFEDAKDYATSQTSIAGWKDETLRSDFVAAMTRVIGRVSGLIQVTKELNRNPGKIPSNWSDVGLAKPQMAKPAAGFNVLSKISSIQSTIKYYNQLVDKRIAQNYRGQAKKYLTGWASDLDLIKGRIEELQKKPEDWAAQKEKYEGQVTNLDKWVTDFGKQWLKE